MIHHTAAVACGAKNALDVVDMPVCTHLGLTPQSVNAFGGYKLPT